MPDHRGCHFNSLCSYFSPLVGCWGQMFGEGTPLLPGTPKSWRWLQILGGKSQNYDRAQGRTGSLSQLQVLDVGNETSHPSSECCRSNFSQFQPNSLVWLQPAGTDRPAQAVHVSAALLPSSASEELLPHLAEARLGPKVLWPPPLHCTSPDELQSWFRSLQCCTPCSGWALVGTNGWAGGTSLTALCSGGPCPVATPSQQLHALHLPPSSEGKGIMSPSPLAQIHLRQVGKCLWGHFPNGFHGNLDMKILTVSKLQSLPGFLGLSVIFYQSDSENQFFCHQLFSGAKWSPKAA